MRKGISGFPSLVFILFIFLIAVAIAFLLYITLQGKSDILFTSARDITKGIR